MTSRIEIGLVGLQACDNAVDIGEQVAFLLTGQFREFTDASHPDPQDES